MSLLELLTEVRGHWLIIKAITKDADEEMHRAVGGGPWSPHLPQARHPPGTSLGSAVPESSEPCPPGAYGVPAWACLLMDGWEAPGAVCPCRLLLAALCSFLPPGDGAGPLWTEEGLRIYSEGDLKRSLWPAPRQKGGGDRGVHDPP